MASIEWIDLVAPHMYQTDIKPLAIDLFCGSGSVTAAMKKAGYTVLRAVDFDPTVADTYRANHPVVELFEEDIRELQPKRLGKGHLYRVRKLLPKMDTIF